MDAVFVGLAALLVVGGFAALQMRHLLSAVIGIGVVGMCLAILFLMLGAPDIAITQAVFEVIVVVVMIRANARTQDEDAGRPRSMLAVVAGTALGVVLVAGCAWAFASLPAFGEVAARPSNWYLAEAIARTGASNVVTAVILDFRGYDTLGEATVILVAVAGSLAIARHNPAGHPETAAAQGGANGAARTEASHG
jgi:multisubunit Na+/H+ antiporter MnhB subunit